MDRLEGLLRDGAGERLVHLARTPARPARYAELARPLPDALREAIGVERLWAHQVAAIDRLREGTSVAVATGTASGKSLCFQVPIAEACSALAGDAPGAALVVYPTKALAQDQLRSFGALEVPGLVPATYDGDTSPEARTWVRRNANVVLTNPEMLHSAILPQHGRWSTLLHRLRFVVVDELHVLRGIFGTHVAHVLRRLRRVCAMYGSDPTFVFTSATIGEPGTLASSLCGRPVEAITEDAAPHGEHLLALWNPPLLDEDTGTRAASGPEVAEIVARLVREGVRTAAFCRSRRATERVAAEVKRRLADPDLGLADRVRPYRAGYLPAERRAIEADLFEGRLLAVVATSALELGVDIGGLDACVLNGFPGTIASTRQQMGRAGREAQSALGVLVAGSDQLDQWFVQHPDQLTRRPPEPAVINLANPFIAEPHLACAAYERPLTADDARWWPAEVLDEGVRALTLADRLRIRDGKAHWSGRGAPAPGIGLRSGTSHEVRIVLADGTLVGTVDAARATEVVHPGALYLHQGAQYRVARLDLDDHAAYVEPDDADETTQARSEMQLTIVREERSGRVGRARLGIGPIEVTTQVVGYERRDRAGTVIERVGLDLPSATLHTRAFWWVIDEELLARARVEAGAVPGTLHAAEHAAIGILPLFTICDRWDVGGVSTPFDATTGHPTIVIYDGYPGGTGIAELGFAAGRRHAEATLAVVERCRCRHGCPSCVQSPKCGNGNEPLDKAGAVALLRAMVR